jgi:hypothetical protein
MTTSSQRSLSSPPFPLFFFFFSSSYSWLLSSFFPLNLLLLVLLFPQQDMAWGTKISDKTMKDALRMFLSNGQQLRFDCLCHILAKLHEIREWMSHQSLFLFMSSSILLMYDGAPSFNCSSTSPSISASLVFSAPHSSSPVVFSATPNPSSSSSLVFSSSPASASTSLAGSSPQPHLTSPPPPSEYLQPPFPSSPSASSSPSSTSLSLSLQTHAAPVSPSASFPPPSPSSSPSPSPILADVRMIDFAHCFAMKSSDVDHDRVKKAYIHGMTVLIKVENPSLLPLLPFFLGLASIAVETLPLSFLTHLFAQTLEEIQKEASSPTLILFENQRRQLLTGAFAASSLIPPWTDEHGVKLPGRDHVELATGWKWSDSWKVDKTKPHLDDEGWEYSSTGVFGLLPGEWNTCTSSSLARRRCWIRHRQPISLSASFSSLPCSSISISTSPPSSSLTTTMESLC